MIGYFTQPATVDAFPQITATSSSRNKSRGMQLSSYSFYLQDVIQTHNATPLKRPPFIKSLYITKTDKQKAVTLQLKKMKTKQKFFRSADIIKGDRLESNADHFADETDTDNSVKAKRTIISIVKKAKDFSQKKKKVASSFANFLTEGNRAKCVQSNLKIEEGLELHLKNINKKVKMLKTINDCIYPHLLKAKEHSIKNEILKAKAKNQLTTKQKLKMSINSNCISIKDLYKQKQYHDKVYYYTNH